MSAVYTYTEARQHFAALLDQAAAEGEVRVKRRDGQMFVITPINQERSPLDIPGVDLGVSSEEILEFIAEGRRYSSTE